jgi:hypothetical protein
MRMAFINDYAAAAAAAKIKEQQKRKLTYE